MNSLDSDSSALKNLNENDKPDYSRPVFSGLLYWQTLFPAFIFGLMSVKWIIPSACLFVLYCVILASFRAGIKAILIMLLLFSGGFFYAQSQLPERPDTIPSFMEKRQKVNITGIIKSVRGYPDCKRNIELENVICETANGTKYKLDGLTVWSWYNSNFSPEIGQQVKLYTKIKPIVGFRNPGIWDYEFYSHTKRHLYRLYTNGKLSEGELGPRVNSFFNIIHREYQARIDSILPNNQGGAFFPALLDGDRSYLNSQTVELFRRSGISHTLALSGLHIGFIVGIGFFISYLSGFLYPPLFLYLSRQKIGVLISVPLVVFYLLVGGSTPSLLRASCMFFMWGIFVLLDRSKILLDGLFVAVLGILLFSPLSVFDLGLQLSVLAIFGISLLFDCFYRPIKNLSFSGAAIIKFFGAILMASICANIAILPVLIWNFGTLSPNILFNLIWIPLLGTIIMPICAFGGIITSFFSTDLSLFLFSIGAYLINLILHFLKLSESMGFLPEYSFYRPIWSDIALYYLIISSCLIWMIMHRFHKSFFIIFLILVSASLFNGYKSKGKLRVIVLDTGQSQSVLIQTPDGGRTLIDGGGLFGSFDMGRSIIAPFLTYGHLPRIDNVILTHKDRDHSEGLAFILSHFKVGTFYYNGQLPSGDIGKKYKKALLENSIPVRQLETGDIVTLDSDIDIHVLNPDKGYEGSSNNRSLVLRVTSNRKGILFLAGDIENKSIAHLLKKNSDINANFLILPHHGSSSSYNPLLYSRVSPEYAAAACGFMNRFGFVAKKVRNELEKRKIRLFTTAEFGAIEIDYSPDGKFNNLFLTDLGDCFIYNSD